MSGDFDLTFTFRDSFSVDFKAQAFLFLYHRTTI